MARVEITHKCIMIARMAARRESMSRETGRSLYIKRCYGTYRIILVAVSREQRKCRDLFADAQNLASRELKQWNKKRHWERESRRHKVRGAHRMAVSFFYRVMKDNEIGIEEVLRLMSEKRNVDAERGVAVLGRFMEWIEREEKEGFVNKDYGREKIRDRKALRQAG